MTTAGTGRPVILDPETLDRSGRAHLAQALVNHAGWCRRNGTAMPSPLVNLLDALLDPSVECQTVPNSRPRPVAVDEASTVEGVELMTGKRAARRLGVSLRTVRRRVAEGRLRTVDGRVVAASITEYLEGRL